MSRLTGDSLWKLSLFTAACIVLHYLLTVYLADHYIFTLPLWKVYIFLVLITLLGYFLVLLVHQREPDKTGIAFIGFGFLKILAAVLFLYPLLTAAGDNLLSDVFSFFIPYFLYLGFDTYFTVRLISEG
jgi:hypothetical protein